MLIRRIPDRNIWVIYVAILLLGVAYGVSIAVLAIHMKNHGIPKETMGGLATAFALGIITFAIPAGSIAKKFGAKKTLLFALLGYAVCVSAFPFLTTTAQLSVARFFDGACSVNVWVAAETALLSRSNATNKAFVMSLYAMSLAIGYVIGPILSKVVVTFASTSATFVTAGVLAIVAALVILTRFASAETEAREAAELEVKAKVEDEGPPLTLGGVLWRTKTSCLGTFAYGYFQASVVLFLPLFLIESKGIPEEKTILITAFFALGMLTSSTIVSRLGDRHGHLLVMRILAVIGGTMVASFVLLPSFSAMCFAVFVAGATLAAISPVSLALQGVVIPKRDLERANGYYNAAYAAGMLIGPPISSVLFTRMGGGTMLIHIAILWAIFVGFSTVFANDDPHRTKRRLVGIVNPS